MLTPENIAPIGAGCLLIAIGAGLVFTNSNAEILAARFASDTLRQITSQSEVEAATIAAEEELAISRFESGCVRHNGSLKEGMQISGVPARTAICTPDGVTGWVDESFVIQQVARTANMDVVFRRFSTTQ